MRNNFHWIILLGLLFLNKYFHFPVDSQHLSYHPIYSQENSNNKVAYISNDQVIEKSTPLTVEKRNSMPFPNIELNDRRRIITFHHTKTNKYAKNKPTRYPSHFPTYSNPTEFPTVPYPTNYPTSKQPYRQPTISPTYRPTHEDTPYPTTEPPTTELPTKGIPTIHPTKGSPTLHPTENSPTTYPSLEPALFPTFYPTSPYTPSPSIQSSYLPSVIPTVTESSESTFSPTSMITAKSFNPNLSPLHPTCYPTEPEPTHYPTDLFPSVYDDTLNIIASNSSTSSYLESYHKSLIVYMITLGVIIGFFVIMSISCFRKRQLIFHAIKNPSNMVSVSKGNDRIIISNQQIQKRFGQNIDTTSGDSLLDEESLEAFYNYNTENDGDSSSGSGSRGGRNNDRRWMTEREYDRMNNSEAEFNPFNWHGRNNVEEGEEEVPVMLDHHHPQHHLKVDDSSIGKKKKKGKKHSYKSDKRDNTSYVELPKYSKRSRS